MRFLKPLQQATLVRRYKRFLADVYLDGELTTIHCPNTGSMKNCLAPGAPLWYSRSTDAKRKYPATWEIATTPSGHLAGINTHRANGLVKEALSVGLIPALSAFDDLDAEVRYGNEGSRIDFLLQISSQAVYVEVKNVTLCEGDGVGYFPDAISQRGSRHLRELAEVVKNGHRAALVYCVQHSGIESVAPARHIDAAYARVFDAALGAGVEVYALGAHISTDHIVLDRSLPVLI
jgi:sugar fermentation stimulation protein A